MWKVERKKEEEDKKKGQEDDDEHGRRTGNDGSDKKKDKEKLYMSIGKTYTVGRKGITFPHIKGRKKHPFLLFIYHFIIFKDADLTLQYSTISRKQGSFTVKLEEGTGETVLLFKDTSSYGTTINNTPCVRDEDTKVKHGSTITMGDITLTATHIPLVFMFHNKKDIASAERKAWIEKIGVPSMIGGKMEYKNADKVTHMIADTLNSNKITKRLLMALLRGIPIINTKWVTTFANNLKLGIPDVKNPEYAPTIENDGYSEHAGLTQESLHVNCERTRLFENVNIVFFEQKQYDMFRDIMCCGGGYPVMWERDVFFPKLTPGCATVALKPTDEEAEKSRMNVFRKRNYAIIDDEMLVKSIVFVRPIKDLVSELERNEPINDGEMIRTPPQSDTQDHHTTHQQQDLEQQQLHHYQPPPAKFPRLYEGAGTSAPPPKKPEKAVVRESEDVSNTRGGIKVKYAYLVCEHENNDSGTGESEKPPLFTTKTFKKSGGPQQRPTMTSPTTQIKPIKLVRRIVGRNDF